MAHTWHGSGPSQWRRTQSICKTCIISNWKPSTCLGNEGKGRGPQCQKQLNLKWTENCDRRNTKDLSSIVPSFCSLPTLSVVQERLGGFPYSREVPQHQLQLSCIPNVFPRVALQTVLLGPPTPQDLVLVFCLCVCCVSARQSQMSVSRVSSDHALLCLRQGLWLNSKPMHGAGIVSTTYHIRIQTQVLLVVWQALYQLSDTPKVSFLNSQLNICLHVHSFQ